MLVCRSLSLSLKEYPWGASPTLKGENFTHTLQEGICLKNLSYERGLDFYGVKWYDCQSYWFCLSCSFDDNLSPVQPGSLSAKSLFHYQDVNWELIHQIDFSRIQHQTQHDTPCQSTTDRLANRVLSEFFEPIPGQSDLLQPAKSVLYAANCLYTCYKTHTTNSNYASGSEDPVFEEGVHRRISGNTTFTIWHPRKKGC